MPLIQLELPDSLDMAVIRFKKEQKIRRKDDAIRELLREQLHRKGLI
jgi:hypothetical protein